VSSSFVVCVPFCRVVVGVLVSTRSSQSIIITIIIVASIVSLLHDDDAF